MNTSEPNPVKAAAGPMPPGDDAGLPPLFVDRWQCCMDMAADLLGAAAIVLTVRGSDSSKVLVANRPTASPAERTAYCFGRDFPPACSNHSSAVVSRADGRSDRWQIVTEQAGSWLRGPLQHGHEPPFGDLWISFREGYSEQEWRLIERCRARMEEDSRRWVTLARQLRAEKEVRTERDLLAAIFDVADALIVVLNREGRIVRFNRACERVTGYDAAEVHGRHIWDALLLPEEIEPVRAVFDSLRAGLFPNRFENHWVTKDGRRRLTQWSNTAILDAQGKVEYVIATGLDVTECRQAERALQDSERRFRDVALSIADWAWEVDAGGRYTYCSDRVVDILAYRSEELIGRTPFDLMPADEAKRVRNIFLEAAARRAPLVDVENHNLTKDGREVLLLTNGVPIVDAAGVLHGYRGADQDITERRRVEKEKDSLKERVYQLQKMEALGQLAGGVAHDFDNILTVILCCIERLTKTAELDPAARHGLLRSIEQAARQAASVTRSLLTFSRELPTEKRPLLLSAVIEESADLLRRMLPSTIELKTDVSQASGIRLNADKGQLQQLLMNLAINARDAMPDGGLLSITASTSDGPDAASTSDVAGKAPGFVQILVRDCGAGMPPEVRARIFEPFYTTKPRGQGTGLGLTIAENIVKDHSGEITVESKQGKGTTFRILLPCLRLDEEQLAEIVEQASARRNGEVILLIGSNLQLRGIIALSLKSLGYTVEQAANEAEAEECYRRRGRNVQIFIVDADAGGKWNPLAWLRNMQSSGLRVPVIVVSSADAIPAQDHLPPDDRVTYLSKPFRPTDLGRVIDRLLKAADPSAESER